MFPNEKSKVNVNSLAILLFSSFFCVVFATIKQSPIASTETNNAVPCNTHVSRALNDGDTNLSIEQKFMRARPPNAYCVRIESCSELLTTSPSIEKYETRPFNVGGFNWTFILQPFGVGTWISAYVAIDPSGLVGENREVYADLRFLVYSKAKDQYWTSMDISVYPYFNKWEVLSIDKTVYGPKSWKVMKFSTLTKDFYLSDEFSVGGKKWEFKVYPNGNGTGEGNSLSLYVILSENQNLKPYEKVYVRAKLRVLDQKLSKHLEKPILTWFDTPGEGSGFEQFVSFFDLQNPAKGFIVNDTLSVQVEFVAVSSTNYYSSSPAQFMSTF